MTWVSTHNGQRALMLGAVVVAAMAGYWARAELGGPGPQTLYFAGTLSNTGGPLTGMHNIQFIFRKSGQECQSPATPVDVSADGRFSAPVSTASCPGFFDGSEVTYDIVVDGSTVAQDQPVGSVPYARYADQAVNAVESAQSNIVRRTVGPRTLYVRLDGSDTLCDGSADLSAASAPGPCALATLPQAVSRVPPVGTDTVTIQVGNGIHRVAAAGQTLVRWTGQPPLVLRGASASQVTLSGAEAGADTTPSGDFGVWASDGARISVVGIGFEYFRTAAIRGTHNADITLQNVVVTTSAQALLLHDSIGRLEAAVDITGIAGNTPVSATASHVYQSGTLSVMGGNTLLLMRYNSVFEASGNLLLGQGTSHGLYCDASRCALGGTFTADMLSSNGWVLVSTWGAMLTASTTFVITNAQRGFLAQWAGAISINLTGRSATMTSAALAGSVALNVSHGGRFLLTSGAAFAVNGYTTMFYNLYDAEIYMDAAPTMTPAAAGGCTGSVAAGDADAVVGAGCGLSGCQCF